MPSLNKKRCPTCGRSINSRVITLFDGMVMSLIRVYIWCKQNNVHEFARKDIKHLLKGANEIARFGDWVMFGGLVYKYSKGHYGLNLGRCREFFSGKRAIASVAVKNPITGEIIYKEAKFIGEIKNIREFLDKNGQFISEYM